MIVPNRVNACHDALHRAELALLRRLRAILAAGGTLADLDRDVDAYARFWEQVGNGLTANQIAAGKPAADDRTAAA